MEVPPTSFGRSRRAPEHVGALVVLVSLVVQRLDQEICEVLVETGMPGVHDRLLAVPPPTNLLTRAVFQRSDLKRPVAVGVRALEGIVSKRTGSPYRSGRFDGRRKITCSGYERV